VSAAANLYVKKLVLAPRECGCPKRRHGKQGLAVQEKTVLWYIADSHTEEAGIAWPSIGELARCSGLSARRTQEILAGLICKGVIGRQARLRANGSNSSNGYYFPAIDGLKSATVDLDGRPAKVRRKPVETSAAQLVDSLFDAAESRRVGCDPSQGEGAMHRILGCDVSQGEDATYRTPMKLPVEASPEAPLEAPREASLPLTPPPAEGRRSKKPRFPIAFPAETERQIDAVMQACGFGDERLRKPVGKQLELERNKGEPLPTTALAMIAAWRRFVLNGHLMRVQWGPAKFFGHGHWRKESAWPWDRMAMEQQRLAAEARVGSFVQ
jgi:hypothetical protein